jgi:hypothetical protein
MVVLLVIAMISVWHWISSSAPSSAASPSAPAGASTPATTTARGAGTGRVLTKKRGGNRNTPAIVASLDPTLRFDLLRSSENREYTGGKRNIFEAENIVIPTPLPPTPKPLPGPVTPPGPPPPPPINLKFYGFANKPGETKQIFLLSGDDVFLAREGEIVNRRYRVIRITNNAVEIEDVLNNNRQTIPLTAS